MPDARTPRAPLEIIDPNWYGAHGPPHDAWTRLRREAPVAYCEPPGMLPFWAIVRHDDIVRISRDPEHFQNAPRLAVFPEEQFATDNFPVRHLINMDPPEHRHYRHLLSGHFTPRAVEATRGAVERLVDEILDGVAGRSEIDFVTDVAAVMPIAVIAEMLGLPEEDRPLFFRWTNETLGATDPEYQEGATVSETTARAVQAQKDYFTRMVELRRRKPTTDFMSILANAKLDGAWIPDFELLSYLILLVVAGNETTRNAASGGLLALIQNPSEFAKLQRDPNLVRSATRKSCVGSHQSINFVARPSRMWSCTANASAPESTCVSSMGPPIVTRRCSRIRSPSASTAIPTGTSRSASASTCAWAHTWRVWSCRCCFASSSNASITLSSPAPSNACNRASSAASSTCRCA